ncbi:MAG: TAXI family TRAP transporter solute-binding subunit [Candidatus Limnocylindria bacterium]
MSVHATLRGRRRRAATLLAAGALALGACTPAGEGDGDASGEPDASGAGGTTQLSIATGGTGGVYYPLGGGFATVIGEQVDGYSATVSETNASVDNMQLIGDGGADLALVLGDTAADAVNGEADFEGAPVNACALGRLYDNYTQILTSADSGITSIEDMEGTSVSLGSPGSGTEIIALRILEAAGIDPDSGISRQQLGVAETVEALRDGTIDAGFWSGGLPTGALVEYATTGEMALIPHGEYATAMQDAYGAYYTETEIPADTYEGQAEAISVVVVPNVLVANPDNMDEGLQEQITAAIFDSREQLTDVHPAAADLDPTTAGEVEYMDVCPGSQAYFDGQ